MWAVESWYFQAKIHANIAVSAAGQAVFSNDETRRALTKLATDTNYEDVRSNVRNAIANLSITVIAEVTFSNTSVSDVNLQMQVNLEMLAILLNLSLLLLWVNWEQDALELR